MTVELKLSKEDNKRQINGYFCYKFRSMMWGIAFCAGSLLLLFLLRLLNAQYFDSIRRFLGGVCTFMGIFCSVILLFIYLNMARNFKNSFQQHSRDGFLSSRVSLENNLFTLENLDLGQTVTHTLTPEHIVKINKQILVIVSPQKQDLVILPNIAEVRTLFEENHIPIIKCGK